MQYSLEIYGVESTLPGDDQVLVFAAYAATEAKLKEWFTAAELRKVVTILSVPIKKSLSSMSEDELVKAIIAFRLL